MKRSLDSPETVPEPRRERIPLEEDDASDAAFASGVEEDPEARVRFVEENTVRSGIDELPDLLLEAERRENLPAQDASSGIDTGFVPAQPSERTIRSSGRSCSRKR
jgi:hypothetical protein